MNLHSSNVQMYPSTVYYSMASNLQSSFQDSRGLRLLSLDGGGIRGLSSLLILKEIMGRVKRDEGLDQVPRPCDYFDIIGGTSTGGLIAIMLGRLRMSVSDAIKAYVSLSEEIFSEQKHRWQDGKFKASLLEKAIKRIVSEHSENKDEEARIFDPLIQANSESRGCRVFVCALSRDNMEASIPTHLRTYESAWNTAPNCKIWEAARATSAAPTFFKPITITDDDGIPRTFVDGGLGVNNPTERVLAEAENLFPDQNVSCILSIGTGQAKTISMSKTNAMSMVVPDLQLLNAVKKMATDCERMADKMSSRFAPHPGVYFRFSVDQGMQDIGLGAFERLSELAAHTSAYLRLHDNDMRVNGVASALRTTRSWATLSVGEVAH
ncbi:acyl transferase/acyl hydrolase/lysophospholipase [Rhizoctonia solani]|nr:acyl transferase/acyl hydrolase/lysophospholipase [Rhizoctonia solani]